MHLEDCSIQQVRNAILPGKKRTKLQLSTHYPVAFHDQLQTHRHPIPLSEDRMHKLGGITTSRRKIWSHTTRLNWDGKAEKKLVLSILTRLPFGIKSTDRYSQELMDQLIRDINCVFRHAVYFDDIHFYVADVK